MTCMAIRHVWDLLLVTASNRKKKKIVLRKCYFIVIGKMGVESDHHWAAAETAVSPLWHSDLSQHSGLTQGQP